MVLKLRFKFIKFFSKLLFLLLKLYWSITLINLLRVFNQKAFLVNAISLRSGVIKVVHVFAFQVIKLKVPVEAALDQRLNLFLWEGPRIWNHLRGLIRVISVGKSLLNCKSCVFSIPQSVHQLILHLRTVFGMQACGIAESVDWVIKLIISTG